jgi:hypothetical protein
MVAEICQKTAKKIRTKGIIAEKIPKVGQQ